MALNPLMAFGIGADTGAPFEQQRQSLDLLRGQIAGIYGPAQTGGLTALQTGQTGALGSLVPGYETAQNYITGYTGQAIPFLTQYTDQARQALETGQQSGLDTLMSGVNRAIGAYDPVSAAAGRYGGYYAPAATTTLGALGLGGPEARTAAINAFQTSP